MKLIHINPINEQRFHQYRDPADTYIIPQPEQTQFDLDQVKLISDFSADRPCLIIEIVNSRPRGGAPIPIYGYYGTVDPQTGEISSLELVDYPIPIADLKTYNLYVTGEDAESNEKVLGWRLSD